MKVGTDGVLLGAWARMLPGDGRVLDIGTGTGLIALMLAQRSGDEVRVTGIDIGDVGQARENAEASPWGGRVEMVQCSVQAYEPAERFDLIVSNPPYFVDSLTCPDAERTRVRHAVELTFEELRDGVLRLLTPAGRLAVVLPVEQAQGFETLCAGQLFPLRRTRVRTTPQRAPKRMLLELGRVDAPVEEAELVVGTGIHEEYTPEYRALTGDFYLKF